MYLLYQEIKTRALWSFLIISLDWKDVTKLWLVFMGWSLSFNRII